VSGARRRAGVAVGACLVAVSCTALSNKTHSSVLRTTNGGGPLLGLHSVDGTRDQGRLRADRFCVDAAAAIAGGDLLDCQLVPFGNAASTACPSPSTVTVPDRRDPFADVDRCQPLPAAVASQALGWVVSERDRNRKVSIYLGTTDQGPTSASATPQPTMVERFRADDDANRWSELAVCPSDLDGDGLNELVVLTRPWDELERNPPDESERPEMVAVWLQPPMRSAASTPLRTLSVSRSVPRARGEGCASPIVQTLHYDDGVLRADLELDEPRRPPPVGIAR
jgi:hypothetical protein